jgi:hypothetical protein
MKDTTKPDGWDRLRPEGGQGGPPEVGHDKQRHRNYTVYTDPATGEPAIRYHDVPEGFTFRDGILVPQDAGAAGQVTGTPAQPANIPAAALPPVTEPPAAAGKE